MQLSVTAGKGVTTKRAAASKGGCWDRRREESDGGMSRGGWRKERQTMEVNSDALLLG